MKTIYIIFVLYAICIGACSYVPENLEVFVSPNGNDNSTGTIETPFQTIERAKQEVKKIKQKKRVR